MAHITPLGGPQRNRKHEVFWELQQAITADLRASTPETRAQLETARAHYLAEKAEAFQQIEFQMRVSERFRELTAPPAVPLEPKRREWLWPTLALAGAIAFVLTCLGLSLC